MASIPTRLLFKVGDEKTVPVFIATVISVFGITALAFMIGFTSGEEGIALLIWLCAHFGAWCCLVGYAIHRRMQSE